MKLPLNCTVHYIEDFLTAEEASELYQLLLDQYQIDQARIIVEAGGQIIETDSFKIIFSTEELIQQNHHIKSLDGKVFPWKGIMLDLKEKVERLVHQEFELAMCLYYPDGNYFAPYHSDQQTSGYKTILPSISLGEVRTFCFKGNESEEIYSLDLADGSLLLMGEYCQDRYMHSLPKDPKYLKGRINITFRERSFK